jgi:hypothetical protein
MKKFGVSLSIMIVHVFGLYLSIMRSSSDRFDQSELDQSGVNSCDANIFLM